MKRYLNNLFVIALTLGLGLTGLNATAVTSNQDSSPVFNAKSNATFIDNIDTNSNYLSNPFISTNSDNSSFATGSNGRNQSDLVVQQPGTSDGYSQQFGFNTGEIGKGGDNHFHHDNFRFTTSPVPEPAEYLLIACGLAMIYFVGKRRRVSIRFTA